MIVKLSSILTIVYYVQNYRKIDVINCMTNDNKTVNIIPILCDCRLMPIFYIGVQAVNIVVKQKLYKVNTINGK